MIESDFAVIYNQAFKLANDLSVRVFDNSFLSDYEIYSNNITQLIQILNNMPVKSEKIKLEIKNLLEIHKKVEYRLIQEKNTIAVKISNRIRKTHIQQKYYSMSMKHALLNKKI